MAYTFLTSPMGNGRKKKKPMILTGVVVKENKKTVWVEVDGKWIKRKRRKDG